MTNRPADDDARAVGSGEHGPAGLRGGFGPMTAGRRLLLAGALAFLAGTIGYAIGQRTASGDPLSATDVGFFQDMGYHHDQANRMALTILGNQTVRAGLRSYATEIIMDQRQEQGIYNATLDRFGHDSAPGATAMGWMGHPVAPDRMDGMATERQVRQLTEAHGLQAESLFVALMSEHHLGGMQMADHEVRHGHDRTARNLASASVRAQRGEVIDLARYRTDHGLSIAAGFTDPLRDPRLNPPSVRSD